MIPIHPAIRPDGSIDQNKLTPAEAYLVAKAIAIGVASHFPDVDRRKEQG